MSGEEYSGRSASPGGTTRRDAFCETDRLIGGLLKEQASDDKPFAGAVLLVSQAGTVLKHEAYGYAELFDREGNRLPAPRAMQPDTIFDLASITKVAATANLAALLFEEKALDLNAPLADYLPVFDRPDKRDITVAHLLTHSSGLASWLPFYLFVTSGDEALDLIADLPATYPLGRKRVYSDVNFIVLGKVLEGAAGLPLDRLMKERIVEPLGLNRTGYRPPAIWRSATAATSLGNRMEQQMCETRSFPLDPPLKPEELPGWRRDVIVGEVNDANCHLVFEGASGHAGLFATAEDLARLARELLYSLNGRRSGLFRRDTLSYFTTPKVTPGQGLGWWTNRLDASPRTFGHRGFTGTQLFIDPENDLVTVFLSNRVHSELPYREPASFTGPVLTSVYRALAISEEVAVDPWLER